MPVKIPQAPVEPESGRGCLPAAVRLIWIFGGIALIYCALYIAQRESAVLTELLMPFMALALVLFRFLDIRYLKGETLDNKPATLKHWRRYVLIVSVVAGTLYILAKFVAQQNLL